ncbi:MAG: efflux RND transporter periplasmic adaptor subunit, partial [Gammaproteobacteria bacterium]
MQFQTAARLKAPGMIAVLAVAGLLSTGARSAPPLRLETVEVGYQTLTDEQRFDGEVEAVHRSTISAQTAGEIVELPFDVNDYVPKGAVVLRFDDTKQQAAFEQAQANVIEAQVRLSEAQSAHRRNLRLIKEDAVSQSAVEKSEANLKAAEAKLKLARAARDEAREQLDYTVVEAPYAGVLVERFVEIGEQVQVGEPLGTGLSLEKLRVEVEVPARYVEQIRTGPAPRVLLTGEDNRWIEARDHVV